jgi:hypothetical protein
MHGSNMPLSERIGRAHRKWVDLDAAARLLEATKSAVLSQRMLALDEKSVARAELVVKASEFWTEHVTKVESARTAANHARVELEFLRNQFAEWNSSAADERLRAKL